MKRLVPLLLFLFLPGAVRAEVMDKEPSLFAVWCWAVVTSAVLFSAARFRPWLLLVTAPLPALYFYSELSEVMDAFVGVAMLREAGSIYIASSWVAPVVAASGAIAGWWLRKKHIAAKQGAPHVVQKHG